MSNPAEISEVILPYGSQQVRLQVPTRSLHSILTPAAQPACADPAAEIRRALAEPVGAPPLREAVRQARRVVIAADDLTRQTPVHLVIPLLLDEINQAGVSDEQVSIVIALGTHRPMTPAEIARHFGSEVIRRVQVLNHDWQTPEALVDLGRSPNGTPVRINRTALEADFLIGVGSIVPHHIPGFSAGAKIIQPGLSGAETTGATHYLSTHTRRSYLGMVENPVRAEIDLIGRQAGLKTVMNLVLNPDGSLVRAFYGDFVQAHRGGVRVSQQVYGAAFSAPAEIVVAGSHPCDIEFWQAHKSLYPADLTVTTGGTIIVVTPCPEGVSVTHRDMLEFTALPADQIDALIQAGQIRDLVSAALALAWARVRERCEVYLVSDGIRKEDARALGFRPFDSAQEALQAALRRHGADAGVHVLTHAPDTLPIQRG